MRKQNGGQTGSGSSHKENKTRFDPSHEVKRYQIDMFILYFDNFLEKKQNGGLTGSGASHTHKKTDSCSEGLGHSRKTYFYLILTYFDENRKWWPDDVIPETVKI